MDQGTSSERWLPVPGWEGLYDASDWGRIRSLPRRTSAGMRGGRILKGRRLPKTGYLRVHLCKDGDKDELYIHQLVLLTFKGPCPPGEQACHGDGNPANNRLSNLRWGTPSENIYDNVRNGTHYNARKTHCLRGHEYTPENTYRIPEDGRQCVTCMTTYQERNARAGKFCSKGCGKPVVAKNLCQKHYDQQKWRVKHPVPAH